MARLGDLIQDIAQIPPDLAVLEITGVTCDPALCRPGFLYLAAESECVDSANLGLRLDGRDPAFIARAVANGAAIILTDREHELEIDIKPARLVRVDEPLRYLGPIAARHYQNRRPPHVALVTGTNGKTSTVNFARMLWTACGRKACSVGNLGGVVDDGTLVWDRDPTLSVPETVTLHAMMSRLVDLKVEAVALEATSHALFDHRLDGLPAGIGAFTNLTHDHLDFHGTMDEYFRVKMTLFDSVLPRGSQAVLNADSPYFEAARDICKKAGHIVRDFGRAASFLRLERSVPTARGQDLSVKIMDGASAPRTYDISLALYGYFQVENVLCALAIVLASGVEADLAVRAVETLRPVEGRLNLVATTGNGARVIIDYAHTPDGLRAALEACRSILTDAPDGQKPGRLHVVFGANGERDSAKRSVMGEEARRLADVIVVTDGHTRHEDGAAIRRQVMQGCPEALEIADRREAIEHAVRGLAANDLLLIAGLGHEDFLSTSSGRIPWSDADIARAAAQAMVT
jgi:UDP-N-acetylmuramoyl-L-alanyl-D-glutamate--2,6-diaminopimelate ligase